MRTKIIFGISRFLILLSERIIYPTKYLLYPTKYPNGSLTSKTKYPKKRTETEWPGVIRTVEVDNVYLKSQKDTTL